MSQLLINRNPELKRLRDEGFNVHCRSGFLVVDDVWYVAPDRTVKRGRLVTDLQLSGEEINGMGTHVIHFAGELPCDASGSPLTKQKHGDRAEHLPDLVTDHSFSSKPIGPDGQMMPYGDYYEKVVTYVWMFSSHAKEIDPSKDPRTFPTYESTEDDSVFLYLDTATSRAGIGTIASKLELSNVAIVGLGGTGSYILDLVAKTPVKEIHIFDNDVFHNHNAFRAPGAASLEQLETKPKKVDHFREIYSRMRRGIHSHDEKLNADNVESLRPMDFVFLSLDSGSSKRLIVQKLEEFGIPFIDVGMGMEITGDQKIFGTLRVATSTPQKRDHIAAGNRIPYGADGLNELYATNIQVADLNCLNACMAVIKWKKLFGFYADLDGEHFSTYTVDGNHLLNTDTSCPGLNN